jgi:hypothetical protein
MIGEFHAVESSWRTGFLAKSTTLVSGCWRMPTEINFRAIRVFRGQRGFVGRKLKVESRATELCKSSGGMARAAGSDSRHSRDSRDSRASRRAPANFASLRLCENAPRVCQANTLPNPGHGPVSFRLPDPQIGPRTLSFFFVPFAPSC